MYPISNSGKECFSNLNLENIFIFSYDLEVKAQGITVDGNIFML